MNTDLENCEKKKDGKERRICLMDGHINIAKSHLAIANQFALEEVESIARKELKKNKKLDEFVMGMGTWFFTEKKGSNIRDYEVKELEDFMMKYNDHFGLSGSPMRFTADGKKVTDWGAKE